MDAILVSPIQTAMMCVPYNQNYSWQQQGYSTSWTIHRWRYACCSHEK